MTMSLQFDLSRLPRNMTKAQWKELDRWWRSFQRLTLYPIDSRMEQFLADFSVYGTATMDSDSWLSHVARASL